MKTLPFLILIVTAWSHFAAAADLPVVVGDIQDREEVPLLYNHLSQNIEEEAGHYSEYIDYRKNLRLKDFWNQLEQLNLSREEIIQTIALLEKQMEGQIPTGTYRVSSAPFTLPGPGYLSNIFSNWRPFYFLISGGFFLVISSILLYYYCISCRQSVLSMMIKGLQSLSAHKHFDLQKGDGRDQDDDFSCYRDQDDDFSYCVTCRKSVLPAMINFLKGLSAQDHIDLGNGDRHHDDDFHKEAA